MIIRSTVKTIRKLLVYAKLEQSSLKIVFFIVTAIVVVTFIIPVKKISYVLYMLILLTDCRRSVPISTVSKIVYVIYLFSVLTNALWRRLCDKPLTS